MKLLVSLFLIITISFSRDSYNLAKLKNTTKYNINNSIHFYYLDGKNHLYTNFDLLAILSTKQVEKALVNPNYTTKIEKEFVVLTEILYYLLENTKLINNKDTAIGLIINNQLYAYDKLLVIPKNELDNLNQRLFSNIEIDKASNFNQIPPFYPMKKALSKAKIYTAKKNGSGYDYKYDKDTSKKYHKFITNYSFNKHILENYIDDAYDDYSNIKNKIHGCVINENEKCIKRYISYGFDLNIKDDENNQTPLIYAVSNGYYDIVKLLINNGANANIIRKGYMSPYFEAKDRGFNKIANFLKPHTTVTTKPKKQNSKRFCYSINNPALQAICKQGTKTQACYGLDNPTLRSICLNGTSYCNLLDNSALRGVCQNGKSYCNLIDNSKLKYSCKKYNGDMLFWIIMASKGYIIKQH